MNRVTLFRDHPLEGWRSMDRYAETLADALQQFPPSGWEISMPLPPGLGSNVYLRMANRMLRYPAWAQRQHGDVNHVLDHSYGHLVFGLDPERTVVTVHDLAPLHFSGRPLGASRLAWRRALRGALCARHLIVASRFVARELEGYANPARSRVHLVPYGVAARFRPPTPELRAAVRRCYLDRQGQHLLLHVGRIHARKNLPGLLEAVARLRAGGRDVHLVQVGGRRAPLAARIRALDLDLAVRFTGRVSEDDLVDLYGAADVFILPSLYEGFGLPVLEAMACGAPVVAAQAASLPEVVGDAGLLASPRDPAAIAAAVGRILDQPALAENLHQRGLARARRFPWSETARLTWEVYGECAEDARCSEERARGTRRGPPL